MPRRERELPAVDRAGAVEPHGRPGRRACGLELDDTRPTLVDERPHKKEGRSCETMNPSLGGFELGICMFFLLCPKEKRKTGQDKGTKSSPYDLSSPAAARSGAGGDRRPANRRSHSRFM